MTSLLIDRTQGLSPFWYLEMLGCSSIQPDFFQGLLLKAATFLRPDMRLTIR